MAGALTALAVVIMAGVLGYAIAPGLGLLLGLIGVIIVAVVTTEHEERQRIEAERRDRLRQTARRGWP